MPSQRSLPLQLLLLLGAAQSTMASSMSAWWTEIGPQIFMQNATTGALQYSMCNSNNTPIFPNNPPLLLSLEKQPRNGTAVAGVGWWDNEKTIASIFYQATNGDIINTYLECDWNTGKFNSTGSWVISGNVPNANDMQDINSNTGLAALVLGATTGYRVYYHDLDMQVNQIAYTTDTNWHYQGVVSRDPMYGTGLHAQFSDIENITVAAARDHENVEVSRYNSDGFWHLSSIPQGFASNSVTNATNATDINLSSIPTTNFTLPAWDGNASLAVSIDKAYVRNIFYIGNDSALHQVANINSAWQAKSNQSADKWPLADEPNADLALASDFQSSVIRAYYLVNGTLAEVSNGDDGTWQAATALATFNATAPADGSPASSSGGSSSSGGGLSTGATVGIGIGAGVGGVALLGIAGTLLYGARKRRAAAARAQQQKQAAGGGECGGSGAGSSPPPPHSATPGATDYGGSTVGSQWTEEQKMAWYGANGYPLPPQELEQVQKPLEMANDERPAELNDPHGISEMPEQLYSHELEAGPETERRPA